MLATMLINSSLTVFTVLVNSLDRSTDHRVELFMEQCNQLRNFHYLNCQENTLNGTQLIVNTSHFKKERRIDAVLETIWIKYLCAIKGCKINDSPTNNNFDLLMDSSPRNSRDLLPLFPYRTVKYSIFVGRPDPRVRPFACFYVFSSTLWIVLISTLCLSTLAGLLIHSLPFSYNPVPETLQSMYNLFLNNGSTKGVFRSNSSKIVFIVCSMLVMIIWISFSTFLIAELAVTPPDRLHGDLRQLLTDRKLKAICVEPNTAVHAHLVTIIGQLINVAPCPTGWPQRSTLFMEVCNSQVAFVETSSFLQEYNFFYTGIPPCQLFSLVDNVFQIPKAIIARRGFPHREEVNQMFMKVIEHGITQQISNHMFGMLSFNKQYDQSIQEGYLKISISRLEITFGLLGCGACLAAIILILEVAYYKRQRRIALNNL